MAINLYCDINSRAGNPKQPRRWGQLLSLSVSLVSLVNLDAMANHPSFSTVPHATEIPQAYPVQTKAPKETTKVEDLILNDLSHFIKVCGSNKECDAPGCQSLAHSLVQSIRNKENFSLRPALGRALEKSEAKYREPALKRGEAIYDPTLYTEAYLRAFLTDFKKWGEATLNWGDDGQPKFSSEQKFYEELSAYFFALCDVLDLFLSHKGPSLLSFESQATLIRTVAHTGMMRQFLEKNFPTLKEQPAAKRLDSRYKRAYNTAWDRIHLFSPGSRVLDVILYSKGAGLLKELKKLADSGDFLAKIELAKRITSNATLNKKYANLAGEYFSLAMNAISSHNDVDQQEVQGSFGGGNFSSRSRTHDQFTSAHHTYQQQRLVDLNRFLTSERAKAKPGQPDFFWHFLLVTEKLPRFQEQWMQLVAQYYENFEKNVDAITHTMFSEAPLEKRKAAVAQFFEQYQDAIADLHSDQESNDGLRKKLALLQSIDAATLKLGLDPKSYWQRGVGNLMSVGGTVDLKAAFDEIYKTMPSMQETIRDLWTSWFPGESMTGEQTAVDEDEKDRDNPLNPSSNHWYPGKYIGKAMGSVTSHASSSPATHQPPPPPPPSMTSLREAQKVLAPWGEELELRTLREDGWSIYRGSKNKYANRGDKWFVGTKQGGKSWWSKINPKTGKSDA